MKAKINKIIENTFIDGPGSRFAVFFQQCNMTCLYCHNPETQKLCSDCGTCVPNCPTGALKFNGNKVVWEKNLCQGCDTCINVCPNHSSPKILELSVEDILERLKKLEPFLDGITTSGGECTLNGEFIYELFSKIKSETDLTTFIDTNGTISKNILEKLCKVTDGFMFDLKSFNSETHKKLTGLDNNIVKDNIKYVSDKKLLYEVRTVLVEGYTDSADEISEISSYIKNLNDYTHLKLIPFRPFGVKGDMSTMLQFSRERYSCLFNISKNILQERVIE
ncbi:MAG: yjjW [Clostridiaceae bacterium]|nr:yjjW [Clostridiaceae bacterium]